MGNAESGSAIVHLDGSSLRRLLPPERAVAAVEEAYAALFRGEVESPLRTVLPGADGTATTLVMPARGAVGGERFVAVKVVSVAAGNRERGLPTTPALVLLVDAVTGLPLVTMDGTTLTAIRTGAASGAATRALAREDASVLAMIGAGGQAWDQVASVLAVRPVREVLVYAPTRAHAEALCRRVADAFPEVSARIEESSERAVAAADIVCCATSSRTPVFPADAVRPGTHVNGVGSFRPDMVELPPELLRGPVYVETREIALEESGEILAALRAGTLAEEDLVPIGRAILAAREEGRATMREGRAGDGETRDGRTRDGVTVFKSAGSGAQDLFAAVAAYRAYLAGRDGGAA